MKKLLLAGLLALLSTSAHASCSGIFSPNTYCGNNSGTSKPPFQISGATSIVGPGSSTVGDFAIWNNITGSVLADKAPSALTKTDDTNITVTLGGSASTALFNPASITMGWTGTLAAARLNANVVQAITNDTNVTGSIAAQNLTLGWSGTLASTRLNANVVQSIVNDTNVTGSISAQALTLGWTGTLSLARGGTAAATQSAAAINLLPVPVNVGDILYWNGSIWTSLPGNTSGTQLLQENSSGLPSWVTVAGTGTVTSIAAQAGLTSSPNPITSTGTISVDGNYSGWATQNCTLAASIGSSLLTVALKDNAGADPSATSPCNINYRNVTPTAGSTTLVSQTAALSISTFATGASLGSASSATPFRFWVVAFNNGGTNVLALINCTSASQIFPLNQDAIASSTAISGSATSAGVFYTPNGTTITSKAFRILGYVEYASGLTTAGTYATAPTLVQNFGPGQKRPGEPVQVLYSTITTTSTSSTATYAPSAVARNFTKTSAANSVELNAGGSWVNNAAGTAGLSARFYQGNGACSTAIGGAQSSSVAASLVTPVNLSWLDVPVAAGTAAAQYTVCILSTTTTSFTYPYAASGGSGANLILKEIMG